MKALLIFDNVNDLLYSKWDAEFIERMKSLSEQHSDLDLTDGSKVSQLLSPIITSQRVMAAQFGNTYSSMQCKDDTTIVFDEWLDHIFMIISEQSVDDAQREMLDLKTFVQHICGQNINLLQSPVYRNWLSVLIDSRTKGDSIPGATGIIGETGATGAALNALKSASKQIKGQYHLMLFVGDKQLALYSSRGTEELTPSDLILLSMQCIAAQEHWEETSQDDDDETIRLPWLSEQNSAVVQLCAANSPCAPHSLHMARVAPRLVLLVLRDMQLREVGIAANMASQILSNLRRLLLQRNLELLPSTLDSLEAALKKTTDALRKNKSNANLCARLQSRMLELRKSCTTTTPLTPETTATAMHTALETVIELLKPDIPSLNLAAPLKEVKTAMAPYIDFLKIKAQRYFSMGSYPFQFLHSLPRIQSVSCSQVHNIISRCCALTREGYSAATWRRGAIHACSVLWWERRGAPARPARPPHPAAVRALPPPGDILNSFYRQLVELAFPNDSQGVTIKELICVHLGLLPATTAVQQARRLAHTVHELFTDNPTSATDLL
ncbi:uncharacterized protein LOC125229864 [Leguminivora glycinivorella]|uniref:uncharacterized protein LOC125229864 n=1 Tax=Leguminivora glycinivorella TaxID=1035111 RepID=UPI00200FFA8C|nr:uncharacterized protein LOC125229864 [Leguminivora glycinivorella]